MPRITFGTRSTAVETLSLREAILPDMSNPPQHFPFTYQYVEQESLISILLGNQRRRLACRTRRC